MARVKPDPAAMALTVPAAPFTAEGGVASPAELSPQQATFSVLL